MGQRSFQEVMKQWRRFCKSHSNCGECEFDGKGICGEAHLSDVPYSDMELRIMSWAAEHPEPVYPTWEEWLLDTGVFAPDNVLLNGKRRFYMEGKPVLNIPTKKIYDRIPDDIAERLGLEPKEG